ncbi:ATP-binding response regulator [Chenggangzhangella methanolivorans]|uniref:histidine kinase n=1 Tax=Chenggangzhangella methanolivorans TaxID=1437009 RepID=A0A9E6RBX4_9HYPH|nr:hybrid sensor histidine kinase/response regulator [Chenggangzhangella methanolivorans]QZO01035.1 hybrid sensor histidine kinase/response regulator [Chenggangzhangella methanolivorans]
MSLAEIPDDTAELKRRIAKLERMNAALMDHVERSTDRQGSAYSLFQTAITLDTRVRDRTEELTNLMLSLERSNRALVEAKEEAEFANRSKTRFLAAASHDLLQPLNAARLSISTLADMPLGVEALAIAGQVERGLKTIEDLIKALIDISKLDAGVVRPNVRSISLNDVLEDVVATFEPVASRKGLRFVVKTGQLAVESDPVLLKRILQNLVSNAVRYARRGGVLVRARSRGGSCLIDVVDTGPGITPADRARIFEEFYRGEGASGDAEIGLGLGLSIVRRMTLALGHSLKVSSKVGRGSRFRLRLALAQGEVRERNETGAFMPPVSTTLSGSRIVVVENDVGAREALVRLLVSWEATVVSAHGLEELKQALAGQSEPPHIALIDYHLDGGVYGLEVAAWLRATYGADTPAIVTTADHSAEVAAEVRAAGCELIHKPIKPAYVRALMSHLAPSVRRGE